MIFGEFGQFQPKIPTLSQMSDLSPGFHPVSTRINHACAQVNHGRHVNSSDAKVSKCPTTTRPRRERVMVTLRRRGSPRKPTLPLVLARTVLTKIKSWRKLGNWEIEKLDGNQWKCWDKWMKNGWKMVLEWGCFGMGCTYYDFRVGLCCICITNIPERKIRSWFQAKWWSAPVIILELQQPHPKIKLLFSSISNLLNSQVVPSPISSSHFSLLVLNVGNGWQWGLLEGLLLSWIIPLIPSSHFSQFFPPFFWSFSRPWKPSTLLTSTNATPTAPSGARLPGAGQPRRRRMSRACAA